MTEPEASAPAVMHNPPGAQRHDVAPVPIPLADAGDGTGLFIAWYADTKAIAMAAATEGSADSAGSVSASLLGHQFDDDAGAASFKDKRLREPAAQHAVSKAIAVGAEALRGAFAAYRVVAEIPLTDAADVMRPLVARAAARPQIGAGVSTELPSLEATASIAA